MNNLGEQDRRRVKQRMYPMPGFKRFANAAVATSGIGLVRELRKGQFDTSAVIVSEGTRVSHVREAALAV